MKTVNIYFGSDVVFIIFGII